MFIHLSTDEFPPFGYLNSAAVNILFKQLFSIPLGLYLEAELLGHMVILYLTF